MSAVKVTIFSKDRCFTSGIESVFASCEETLDRQISVDSFYFEKSTFESDLSKTQVNKKCDILIFDCNCNFMDFYYSCTILHNSINNHSLKAKLLFFYEVEICLPNAAMYDHFTMLKKNISVDDFRFFFMNNLFQSSADSLQEDDVKRIDTMTYVCKQHLTVTEIIVIKELIRGRKPFEIARNLNRSIKTISSHKNRALKKMNSKSMSNLIIG